MRTTAWAVLAFGAGASLAAAAPPPDARATGRALLTKHGGAIVTVKLVLKRRMVIQGQERGSSEMPSEISGTVISPSGLTVVSDSASNPWSMFGGDSETTKIDTDTTDVKILLPDGKEIGARFVLRDRDLDLAFIQPEGESLNLPYVSLEGGKVPQPLDDLLFLFRMGKTLNREICIAQGQVQGIVRKPRTFVISDWLSTSAALGGPAFDATGSLVGLVVLRRAPGAGSDRMSNPGRILFDMMAPVVLTVPDLKPVVEDALRAVANSAKPAE